MGGMSGGLSAVQSVYNMVEDNKNIRRNYNQETQQLMHEQQVTRQKKTNILEQNLAERRARVAAMGLSNDGSAGAEQNRETYNAHKDMAEDDYNYYNDSIKKYRDTRYKIRKNTVNGSINAAKSLLQ